MPKSYVTRMAALCIATAMVACSSNRPNTITPLSPSPSATVTRITVSGTSAFTGVGAFAQFSAMATFSDGTSAERNSVATWQSDNPGVATVQAGGLVTTRGEGDATISARLDGVSGSLRLNVRVGPRTPDPAPGQRLALPDVRGFVTQRANARPDLLASAFSCPTGFKYNNNPWLDYIVDGLRTLDTRWGYNGKPTRTAADNGGRPVTAAGDEIAYHWGAGPSQGSTEVYLIDILENHCGDVARLTWRDFTGGEPGFWSGAGRF